MAQKKAPTNDELLAQFEDLGADETAPSANPSKAASKPSKPSTSTPAVEEDDPLAELANLAKAKPISRPDTPRGLAAKRTAAEAVTPSSTGSARTSEDRVGLQRKSGESARSYHQGQIYTPASTSEEADSGEEKRRPAPKAEKAEEKQAAGGGWWGGFLSTATAAVKQAEAAVKEIQKNEEAKKWTEQVRARAGDLRGFGMLHTHIPTPPLFPTHNQGTES